MFSTIVLDLTMGLVFLKCVVKTATEKTYTKANDDTTREAMTNG